MNILKGKKQEIHPLVCLEDSSGLKKREEFAISLRQRKKQEILTKKRQKLIARILQPDLSDFKLAKSDQEMQAHLMLLVPQEMRENSTPLMLLSVQMNQVLVAAKKLMVEPNEEFLKSNQKQCIRIFT